MWKKQLVFYENFLNKFDEFNTELIEDEFTYPEEIEIILN